MRANREKQFLSNQGPPTESKFLAAKVHAMKLLAAILGLAFAATTLSAAPATNLLTRQGADGEIEGWKSFHEQPGATTGDVWKLGADGVLTCRGEPKGYLYTEQDHQDFTLTFEWRWPPGGKAGNGGVLLRTTGKNKIWPKCLEVQLNADQAGDFWAIGGFALSGASERTTSMDHEKFGRLTNVKKLAAIEKPVGEWNTGEVTLIGGHVTVRMNGKLVNQASGCELAPGKILLTAEGQEIQFRNVRLSAPTGEVVTYPAPTGETLSTDYEVWANDQKVDVYTARTLDAPFAGKEWNFGGPYSFANFDMAGRVTVRVRAKKPLRNTVLRPASDDFMMKFEDDHTLTFALNGPRKLSVEPDGKNGPLLLFANPLETIHPKSSDPGVVFFGPGVHQAGRIDLTNGQTLYLAGGAVVKGAVAANGSNLRILGRGILDGSDYEWRKGPYGSTIGIQGSNVLVEGITIRGSSHWTIVPRGSQHVIVRGVKLCNSRVQNDDGINPCNSQDVLITDCFIRSDDDCVAMKGLDLNLPNANVERITVENCVLWCDRARIFLLGHESRAPFMRDITLRNLDIIHYTMTPFLFEPGEDMRLENVLVENVRLHGEGQSDFIRLKPVVNQYMRKKVPGLVKNVRFKNVAITGQPGGYRVQLDGADAEHTVEDVTFENVTILGQPLTRATPGASIGKNVGNVRFDGKP